MPLKTMIIEGKMYHIPVYRVLHFHCLRMTYCSGHFLSLQMIISEDIGRQILTFGERYLVYMGGSIPFSFSSKRQNNSCSTLMTLFPMMEIECFK